MLKRSGWYSAEIKEFERIKDIMTTPLVSVVIPVFNVERYLKECLDSVVQQTLKNIEIICVDDGSFDSSPDILDRYALEDKRIKVIHKENSGYGHTMNVGIDAAKGEYVAIVESDDYIEPDMMEILYDIATKENAEMVKSDFSYLYGDGAHKSFQKIKIWWDSSVYNKVLNPVDFKDIFRGYIANWAAIYKREFLAKHNIRHNESPGASYQDVGFWFQVHTRLSRFYLTDHNFYRYRQDNPNSSINSKGKVYCICDEYDYIYKYLLNNPDIYKKYIYIYQRCRFANYMFTYNRIADRFKLEFLKRFSRDFNEAERKNELDMPLFNDKEKQELRLIMKDPYGFYKKVGEFPKRISKLVHEYQQVIIYGAGAVGKEVLHALLQSDASEKLVCFAVSNIKDNPSNIEGIPVRPIGELTEYRQSAAVLIAVTDKYKSEIIGILKEKGFEHPITI